MCIAIGEGAYLLLLALEFIACCCQIIHLPLCAANARKGTLGCLLAYELSAAIHLVAGSCMLLSAVRWEGKIVVAPLAMPWASLLWGNAVAAFCALVWVVRTRCPRALVEVVLMALCCPLAIRLLGDAWRVALFADAAVFLARTAGALVEDRVRRSTAPTRLSLVETVNVVPVGLLVTDGHARSLVMNDAMRELLEALDCPTDLGDLSDLWKNLAVHAVQEPRATAECEKAGGASLLVPDAQGGAMRVKRMTQPDGCIFYLAENVTDQYLANQRLEQANAQLAEAGKSLRSRLADVQAIAEGEAYLRMRQRVHDVVGQRLSILHRYLEDDRIDDNRARELKGLLATIPRDLRGTEGDPATRLAAVIHAFALVDVEVRTCGSLPEQPKVAEAFVRIVREAATNACRHGRARTVSVTMGTRTIGGSAHAATLFVTDDGAGMPKDAPVVAGSGIKGMRHALQGVGGVLTLMPGHPFSLYAEVPLGTPQGGIHD